MNAFLNQSSRATGTSTVRRLLHWESTDTACTNVPSWTKQKKEKNKFRVTLDFELTDTQDQERKVRKMSVTFLL